MGAVGAEGSAVSAAEATLAGVKGHTTIGDVGASWTAVEVGMEVVFNVFCSFTKHVFDLLAAVSNFMEVAFLGAFAAVLFSGVGAMDIDASVVARLSDITFKTEGDAGVLDIGVSGEVGEEFLADLIIVGKEAS